MMKSWAQVGQGVFGNIKHEAIMRQSDRVREKAASLGYVPTAVQRKTVLDNDPVIRDFTPGSVIKHPTQSAIVGLVRLEHGRKEYDKLRDAEAATLVNLIKSSAEYLSLAPQVIQVLIFGVEKEQD